jgi:hypothetical protein
MAQIAEWGPPMWKLLHSMAERAGSSALELDEKRAWISVLKLTEGVLPCAMCRQHYRDWRRSHPLEDFLGSHGEFFRDRVREWLWGLHNDVNARREVERLPLEGLAKYKDESSKEIQDTLQNIVKILEKAVLHRQINASYVAEWKKAVSLLRRL